MIITKFEYNNITYRNFDTDSTEHDIPDAVIKQLLRDNEIDLINQSRLMAYKTESDPLYIEWRFEAEKGNDTADDYKQKWLVAVNQIKARYPLLTEI